MTMTTVETCCTTKMDKMRSSASLRLAVASSPPTSFSLFPELPKELRLRIWETAIPCERLLRVSLVPHSGRRYELAAAEPRYLQRNALRKPISGERYRAVVQAQRQQLYSTFLRVDHEARTSALRFYRVQLPVYLAGRRCTERTWLYLNPEHDVLHLQAAAPVKETLLDFLWDVKAYDPRDVGLLRLAVDLDSFCASDLPCLQRSDLFLVRQREALVSTLAQLREVWFVHHLPGQHRRKRLPPAVGDVVVVTGLHASWAMPVLAGGGCAVFAERGRRQLDGREGVETSLARVYLGRVDPREMVFRWRRLLRTWGVVASAPVAVEEEEEQEAEVVYRVLVAKSDGGGVSLSLEGEEDDDDDKNKKICDETDKTGTTAGFWLFPVEAVGEVHEGDKLAEMDFRPARVMDLTGFRPELVVSCETC